MQVSAPVPGGRAGRAGRATPQERLVSAEAGGGRAETDLSPFLGPLGASWVPFPRPTPPPLHSPTGVGETPSSSWGSRGSPPSHAGAPTGCASRPHPPVASGPGLRLRGGSVSEVGLDLIRGSHAKNPSHWAAASSPFPFMVLKSLQELQDSGDPGQTQELGKAALLVKACRQASGPPPAAPAPRGRGAPRLWAPGWDWVAALSPPAGLRPFTPTLWAAVSKRVLVLTRADGTQAWPEACKDGQGQPTQTWAVYARAWRPQESAQPLRLGLRPPGQPALAAFPALPWQVSGHEEGRPLPSQAASLLTGGQILPPLRRIGGLSCWGRWAPPGLCPSPGPQ